MSKEAEDTIPEDIMKTADTPAGKIIAGLQQAKAWVNGDDSGVHKCHCKGPQPGFPVCPCRMRFVSVIDGRYVEVNDLGPVPSRDAFDNRSSSTFNRLMEK